jgi:hypothetical protein
MLVENVPQLLVNVQHAHKMEQHVIAVKVDFMLTQTLVNKNSMDYRQFYMNKKQNFSKIGWEIMKN